MYRVETLKLSELLGMWLEDDKARRSTVQIPPPGYTSITDEYGCVWVGADEAVPPHLVDRVVEHYLNARSGQSWHEGQRRDTLVSCQVSDDRVRLVWHVPD